MGWNISCCVISLLQPRFSTRANWTVLPKNQLSVNVSSIEPDRTGDQWGLAGISSARAQLHSLDADRAKAYNNNSSKQQVQTGTRKMKQRDTRSSEGHMNEHVRNTSVGSSAIVRSPFSCDCGAARRSNGSIVSADRSRGRQRQQFYC